MFLKLLLAASILACGINITAQDADNHHPKETIKTENNKEISVPPVVHSVVGKAFYSADRTLKITLMSKKQQYVGGKAETRDADIASPKSVSIHPNGKKYYVNSLEGAKTVVYDIATNKKLKVIKHVFNSSTNGLWSAPSTLYKFNHSYNNPNTFFGRPVESTFSHGGRYLWVPYYRRSYDINAQEPSAIAIIDTKTDCIIRVMETGPLPKMVATSPNGKYIAVSHWGDNTVGLINIASNDYRKWHHEKCIAVGYKMNLNFSTTVPVDRDCNCGYCLRGTIFTPDSRYLLIGRMGGGGGIAVVDMKSGTYIGSVYGMLPNIRHLVIRNGYIYLSINKSGYVQRNTLRNLYQAIANMKNKSTMLHHWEGCRVGTGARTIELSPDGRYIFAAINNNSELAVVDSRTMKKIMGVPVDSYPVGLDISNNGRYILVTSQGRKGYGGNAVNIFNVERLARQPRK